MKKVLLKILGVIKIILLILLVLFVIATAYQKVIPNNPSVFGFRTYSIITNSMYPKLKKGDVILIKEQKISDYKVGDIVTFKGMDGDLKGKIVTHEIVGITKENNRRIFYTKGIKNISKVSQVVVPAMAVFYVIAGIIVILGNISNLPSGIAQIFSMAFNIFSTDFLPKPSHFCHSS